MLVKKLSLCAAASVKVIAKGVLPIVIALCAMLPASVHGAEQAVMADRFADSVGVTTHLFKGFYYPTNAYKNYSTVVKPMLTGLGVRHIRDELAIDNPGGNYYSNLNDLAASGIKCNLILEYPWNYTAAQALSVTKQYLLNAQESVEGTNELDIWPGYSSNWASLDYQYSNDIKAQYGSDPATSAMPILAPTIVTPADTTAYVNAYGNCSSYVTYGNAHLYPWECPETGTTNTNIPALLSGLSPLWGTSPFIVTETGWFTGTHVSSYDAIVQGKYTARALFTCFNNGAYRTYLYELLDETSDLTDDQSNFGLVYNNGSPKPAYNAVKNLIALLSDPGTPFTPGSLEWSLSGNTQNVYHSLFQKRDGSYYLAIWVGANSTDSAIKQAVTISVPSPINAATLYTLDNNGNMSSSGQVVANGQINLNVTDTVSVIKLLNFTGVPAAPTGLTAFAGNGQGVLAWVGSTGATSYNVHRGTRRGHEDPMPIATGIINNYYVDNSASNGTTYFYKVAAVSGAGTSVKSNEASATPAAVYYRLFNRWQWTYLNTLNGSLQCTSIVSTSYYGHWKQVWVDNVNFGLKNRSDGTCINIQSGSLQSTSLDPTVYWSADWALTYVDGTNWGIQNRWQGTYINNQNLPGVQCTLLDPMIYWSADWQLQSTN